MATYEVTGEGVREALESVRVTCQWCEERARILDMNREYRVKGQE